MVPSWPPHTFLRTSDKTRGNESKWASPNGFLENSTQRRNIVNVTLWSIRTSVQMKAASSCFVYKHDTPRHG